MARRSSRGMLVMAAAVLAVLAAGLWFAAAKTTDRPGSTEKFSAPVSPVVTGRPDGTPSRPAPGHPSVPPVPALAGDGYVRNVVPGAPCASVGGRGFTSQSKLMRCTTAAADPGPRWRAP